MEDFFDDLDSSEGILDDKIINALYNKRILDGLVGIPLTQNILHYYFLGKKFEDINRLRSIGESGDKLDDVLILVNLEALKQAFRILMDLPENNSKKQEEIVRQQDGIVLIVDELLQVAEDLALKIDLISLPTEHKLLKK
jgi:hypothetical protein